jgi:hypothetical protein
MPGLLEWPPDWSLAQAGRWTVERPLKFMKSAFPSYPTSGVFTQGTPTLMSLRRPHIHDWPQLLYSEQLQLRSPSTEGIIVQWTVNKTAYVWQKPGTKVSVHSDMVTSHL